MEDTDPDRDYCQCEHEEVHSDRSIWVKPSPTEKVHAPAQKRTYCRKCGKIRYRGTSTARKLGYYINILKELQRKSEVLHRRKIIRSRLTKVQMRLITKDLEEDDEFLDRFSNNRNNQWIHFKKVVRKYFDIDEEVLDSILRDLKG